jgi:hypothetical protein
VACGRALRRIIAITFGESLGFSDETSIGIARRCDGLFGLPLQPVHCSVNKRGMQSFEIAPDTLSRQLLRFWPQGLILRPWPLVFPKCGPVGGAAPVLANSRRAWLLASAPISFDVLGRRTSRPLATPADVPVRRTWRRLANFANVPARIETRRGDGDGDAAPLERL